jgi:hypothetical protein
MTDPDLHAALVALRSPAPDDAARARALHRASLALQASAPAALQSARGSAGAPWFVRLFRPASVLALAVVLLGLFFAVRPPAVLRLPVSGGGLGEVLAQLEQLFPGQLNAVIDRDGVLQLDLSENTGAVSATPPDQGLLVELARGGRRLRVLAYSGRSVRLELAGTELRFDPLLTSDGHVVLCGEDFVWSSAEPSSAGSLAGWHVEARALAPL